MDKIRIYFSDAHLGVWRVFNFSFVFYCYVIDNNYCTLLQFAENLSTGCLKKSLIRKLIQFKQISRTPLNIRKNYMSYTTPTSYPGHLVSF